MMRKGQNMRDTGHTYGPAVRFSMAVLALSGLACSACLGAYPALEALQQSSRDALKRYAQEFASEDPKFEGIVKFGQALAKVEDPAKADLAKLTCQSKDYWRAVIEATPENSSILFAHAHLHAARGETGWADIYFLLGSLTDAKDHREELDTYKRLRDQLDMRVDKELQQGIALHDHGEYNKAITVYNRIISEHPNSAQAYYEKGLSYMMMSKQAGSMKQRALQMYGECRQRDPFEWKAYQGGDPNVIAKLQVCLEKVTPFLTGKERSTTGFSAFVEGGEAMQLYPFAAHGRWKLALIDPDNFQEHLRKFLDLVEKSGCSDAGFLRSQFKLDKPNTPAESHQ
jgi:tetratricopeptide (TPR) repeat protein